MKLGVLFIGNPQSGGLYQYSLSILDSLKNRGGKVVIFNLSGNDFPCTEYQRYFKISSYFKFVLLKEFGIKIYLKIKPASSANGPVTTHDKSTLSKPNALVKAISRLASWVDTMILVLFLKLNRINLVIFTAPTHLSFRLMKVPYIMPVHDLQHRINPQFPEVSADGTWEEREYLYSNAVPNAKGILVDSAIGKEDVLNFYPVDAQKVKILPYTPPNYLRQNYTDRELIAIKEKYHLPSKFLFYPANFWPHKNHRLIIEAISRIKTTRGLEIPVVFTGTSNIRYSSYEKVRELISSYHLESLIYYPGYVPNEDMGGFYKLADALVMPTFFGPTNIPYLEAFALGCPVIGSDIRGVREQIGNAGLLINPDSPEALAEAILKIWNGPELRKTLIRRGYDIISSWNFEKFSEIINGYIDEIGAHLK